MKKALLFLGVIVATVLFTWFLNGLHKKPKETVFTRQPRVTTQDSWHVRVVRVDDKFYGTYYYTEFTRDNWKTSEVGEGSRDYTKTVNIAKTYTSFAVIQALRDSVRQQAKREQERQRIADSIAQANKITNIY